MSTRRDFIRTVLAGGAAIAASQFLPVAAPKPPVIRTVDEYGFFTVDGFDVFSNGKMISHHQFAPINMATGDSLQVTWKAEGDAFVPNGPPRKISR